MQYFVIASRHIRVVFTTWPVSTQKKNKINEKWGDANKRNLNKYICSYHRAISIQFRSQKSNCLTLSLIMHRKKYRNNTYWWKITRFSFSSTEQESSIKIPKTTLGINTNTQWDTAGMFPGELGWSVLISEHSFRYDVWAPNNHLAHSWY